MQLSKKTRLYLTVFLGMLAAMAPLSTDMYLPALPAMTEAFGVSASTVQLTLTMTMAGMAIGQLFAGPISDMRGRRGPLILGMLAFGLSSFVCAIAEDIEVFLVFRFLQGLSGAVGIVIARAIARDICEGPELMRFFAMLMLVNGLAPILAPVVGGQILYFASWRGIFALLAVVGVVLMLTSCRFRDSLPVEMRIKSLAASFKSYPTLLKSKYFLGHCLMQCFYNAAFFAYISGSSFVFQNIYGVSAQVYSYIFGGIGLCVALTGTLPARLAGRVPDVIILVWSLVQGFIGSIILLLSLFYKLHISFVLVSLLVLIPMISIFGASSFSLAMRTNGKMAGSASALIGFFSMISGGIMAPLVGIMGLNDPRPMAIIILVGMALALASFYFFIWPLHRRGGLVGRR